MSVPNPLHEAAERHVGRKLTDEEADQVILRAIYRPYTQEEADAFWGNRANVASHLLGRDEEGGSDDATRVALSTGS